MAATLDFRSGTILPVFDLQVTPMLPTKFRVNNWPFGLGEEAKKKIFKMAILDFRTERVKLFLIYKLPWCFLPSFWTICLLIQKKRKNRFSGWLLWPPSWISDWNDLAFFHLQVIPMLSTKFRVNWPFDSGEEAKNRFSRWPPWRPSWIFDRNNFSFF